MKYLLGIGLIIFAFIILGGTFIPILQQEINYDLSKYQSSNEIKELKPLDTDFGILIPKIGANAHVVKGVDPYNPTIYQEALTKGVAHAKGSVLPGQIGNIFLFSHSSSDFLNATRYNSVFYLLSKLEKSDTIKLFYEGKEYNYLVATKQVTESDAIQFLTYEAKAETLTLMTCWPPGTTLQRLLVFAPRKAQ